LSCSILLETVFYEAWTLRNECRAVLEMCWTLTLARLLLNTHRILWSRDRLKKKNHKITCWCRVDFK